MADFGRLLADIGRLLADFLAKGQGPISGWLSQARKGISNGGKAKGGKDLSHRGAAAPRTPRSEFSRFAPG